MISNILNYLLTHYKISILILINVKVFIFVMKIFMYYKQHPFWFFNCVVHNYSLFYYTYFSKGIICHNPLLYNSIDYVYTHTINDYLKNNSKEIKFRKITTFINENYTNKYEKYIYDIDFLKHIIKFKYNPRVYTINNNEIKALGIGYKSQLHINNTNYPLYYSDYLCVQKQYRNKGLFKSLFGHAINSNMNDECKLFLFKKDYVSLPFKHLIKYDYYILPSEKYDKNINIQIYNNNLINEKNNIYDIFLNEISRKTLYNYMERNEFIDYMNNPNVYIYQLDNTLICLYNTHVYNKKHNKLTYEIVYSIGDYKTKRIIMKQIMNDFELIITSSINGNIVKDCKKISTCYYYLYNYNSDNYLEEDVLLIFL